jgi:hypothetical protein
MKNTSTGLALLFSVVIFMTFSSAFARKSSMKLKNVLEAKAQKEAVKALKMSRYFVKGLIKNLDYNQIMAKKCAKGASAENLAQALQLSFNISTGKQKLRELDNLKTLVCSELSSIPKKLQNKAIADRVTEFINDHMN